ncbi:MAG: carbohydrate-binding family V/XII [Calditrichales bacterium]|nr:MAG: carbohydrate-binding family V/XII [Calditrichales bacterium]
MSKIKIIIIHHLVILVLLGYLPVLKATETEGWPREIETDAAIIVVYQPQVESFEGNRLESRSAVSVLNKGTETPVFGVAWFSSRVETDLDARIITMLELSVKRVVFPDITAAQVELFKRLVAEEFPKWDMEISLDRVIASLEALDRRTAVSDKIAYDPPQIIYKSSPAVLVSIDGEPKLKMIENSAWMYVVNTPFALFLETKSKTYFLKGAGWWYRSKEINGPWLLEKQPPADLEKMLAQNNKTGETDTGGQTDTTPPEIIVTVKPAELLQTDGEAEYSPLVDAELLYVSNSENAIIMDISSQEHYVLISGRWYKSQSLTSDNWTYVASDKLPAPFAMIPLQSELGSVRAHVAGTEEAEEALLENQIPQTAAVDRKSAALAVAYDGDPKFESIPGTGMSYAVNTEKSVLKIEDRYYSCDNAIWFTSEKATGPWVVCTEVPKEVNDIPPESPVYNVKYVYIYDSTPEVVYVGYTPGYMGSYVYGGCVVYGTGYWYHPWYGYHYYPRPVTWGYGVHWNPYTGWGFSWGVRYGGPNMWVSVHWGYRPVHYGYWGPAGYRHGYYHGYRAGYYHGKRAGYVAAYQKPQTRPARDNIYRDSPIKGVRNPGQPSTLDRSVKREPSDRSVRQQPRVSQQPNNVFSDKNGNVYRRSNDTWEKRDKNKWSGESSPTKKTKDNAKMDQNRKDLNRQHQSREKGNRKSQSASPAGGNRSRRR